MIALELIQQMATQLPGVTEDVKWEHDLCFCIGGKMFCVASLELPLRVSFKVTDEEFVSLVDLPGILPAPYMARNKWVMLTDEARISQKELQRLIAQSYEMVKSKLPKKVQQEIATAPKKRKK